MTVKTKIIRAKINLFFTRKRYLGNHPRAKKAVMVTFLIMTNIFIGTVAGSLIPPMKVTMTFENQALAKEIEKDDAKEEIVSEAPKTLEQKIAAAWPDDTARALKVAQCESQMNTQRLGDLHLVFEKDGEIVGDSVGLFQIRTGGNDSGGYWNRANKEGLTTVEYREKLKNEDYNIAQARKIYDQSGKTWGQWTCGRNL